jgi:hypothetical protein
LFFDYSIEKEKGRINRDEGDEGDKCKKTVL